MDESPLLIIARKVADSSPFIESPIDGYPVCFYCNDHEPHHKENCVYLMSQRIIYSVDIARAEHA